MRHTTPTIVVAVALLALTGCSNTEPGKANAAPPEGSVAAPTSSTGQPDGPMAAEQGDMEVPSHGAPKVDSPLDTTRFQQTPCKTLTPDQVEELLGTGVSGTPKIPGAAGPTCSWAKERSTAQIGITFPNISDLGLTGVYNARDIGNYGFLVELPAAGGYPAVGYGTADRRMSEGGCSVRVGTSDRATIDIGVFLSAENVGKTDPCEAGRDIAETVIGNIKAAN